MNTATGEFKIEQWDEKPYQEGTKGRKLTRATVVQKYTGDIVGTGTTEYLMAYKADGTAEFTGLQRIEGKIGGKRGAFVISLSGKFSGKGAKAKITVVSSAGTAALDSLSGKGSFEALLGETGTYTLKYEMD